MKTRISILLVFALFLSENLLSQSFSKVLYSENPKNIRGMTLNKTIDNQYLAAGFMEDWEVYENNGQIIKFDSTGTVIWSKIASNPSSFSDILPTADSGCIILGNTINAAECILLKLNKNGDLVWKKKTNWDNGDMIARSICPTFSNGFAIVGNYHDNVVDAPYNTFVSMFDSVGNELWTKTFSLYYTYSIAQLPDSTLLLTGKDYYTFLLNLNSDGSVKGFKRIIPDTDIDYNSYTLFVDTENIYSVFTIGYEGLCIRKMDFELNQEWVLQIDLTFNNFFNQKLFPKIISAGNEGIILISLNGFDGDLLKIDPYGTISWAKRLSFIGTGVESIGNTGYIVFGNKYVEYFVLTKTDIDGNGSDCMVDNDVTSHFITDTLSEEEMNIYYMDVSPFQNFTIVLTDFPLLEQSGCVLDFVPENEPEGNLKILPNPANESFKIEIENPHDFKYLEIRDISGRMVFQTKDKACLIDEINTSQILPGIYHVSLLTITHKFTSRLVIVR